MKPIVSITTGESFPLGPLWVRQPLPAQSLKKAGPFILLHHAGPMQLEAGKNHKRLEPHPHRGFEPVTFLFDGEIYHRDSMGNEGRISAGDVQWMTSGSGIIHSEGPSPDMMEKGGTLDFIQLWVNLPAKYKMTDPAYQEIKAEQMPVIELDGNKAGMQLVAGKLKDKKGPAKTFTPITAGMIRTEKNATFILEPEAGHDAMLYVMAGEITVNEKEKINAFHLVVFAKEGSQIKINTSTETKLLYLTGEPIHEPMTQYGPFVMNNMEEIQQAIMDYQNGKMGKLDF